MNRINLGHQLSFSIEPEVQRLRLIVSDDGEELVCHEVDRNQLEKFAHATEGHLFKGRLQLDKKGGDVLISVKGDTVGIIALSDFERLVNQSYQPK
jgi:hypothetical protein